jgi:hypothetical protein
MYKQKRNYQQHAKSGCKSKNTDPLFWLRLIFRLFGQEYIDTCNPTEAQLKVLEDVMRCGTETMGMWYTETDSSGEESQDINLKCNNRACPRCHWDHKNKWWPKKMKELPLCSYSHVVVTFPPELYTIIYENQKFWYGQLMKFTADSIKEFAVDEKYLGGLPGILATLQTSNGKMDYHPHLHLIVSNGGFWNNEWVEPRNPYWIPTAQVLQRIKELMLEHVRKNRHLWNNSPATLRFIEKSIQKGQWTINCQPFGKELKYVKDENGFSQLDADHKVNLKMLLKYVSRDVLAGYNIIGIKNKNVIVCYTEGDEKVTQEVNGVEFIWRFMCHVLPPKFHRTRSYGLFHSSKKSELTQARNLFDKKYHEGESMLDAWLRHCEEMSQDETIDLFGCGDITLKSSRTFFVDFKKRKQYFVHSRESPDIPPFR